MDWLTPDPVELRRARIRAGVAGGILILPSLVLLSLAILVARAGWGEGVEDDVGILVALASALLVSGLWFWQHVRLWGASLAVTDDFLWIRETDGRVLQVPRQEVLTDGRNLLAGPRWILLGVKYEGKPWRALYQDDVTHYFRRVSHVRLLVYGLRAGSLFCWLELLQILVWVPVLVIILFYELYL